MMSEQVMKKKNEDSPASPDKSNETNNNSNGSHEVNMEQHLAEGSTSSKKNKRIENNPSNKNFRNSKSTNGVNNNAINTTNILKNNKNERTVNNKNVTEDVNQTNTAVNKNNKLIDTSIDHRITDNVNNRIKDIIESRNKDDEIVQNNIEDEHKRIFMKGFSYNQTKDKFKNNLQRYFTRPYERHTSFQNQINTNRIAILDLKHRLDQICETMHEFTSLSQDNCKKECCCLIGKNDCKKECCCLIGKNRCKKYPSKMRIKTERDVEENGEFDEIVNKPNLSVCVKNNRELSRVDISDHCKTTIESYKNSSCVVCNEKHTIKEMVNQCIENDAVINNNTENKINTKNIEKSNFENNENNLNIAKNAIFSNIKKSCTKKNVNKTKRKKNQDHTKNDDNMNKESCYSTEFLLEDNYYKNADLERKFNLQEKNDHKIINKGVYNNNKDNKYRNDANNFNNKDENLETKDNDICHIKKSNDLGCSKKDVNIKCNLCDMKSDCNEGLEYDNKIKKHENFNLLDLNDTKLFNSNFLLDKSNGKFILNNKNADDINSDSSNKDYTHNIVNTNKTDAYNNKSINGINEYNKRAPFLSAMDYRNESIINNNFKENLTNEKDNIDFQELNTDLNNLVINTNIQAKNNKCEIENTNEIININATTDISTDINVTTQMEIYIVCVKLNLETTSTFIVKFQTGNTAVKKIITEDHKFPIFIKKNEDINEDTELTLKVSEKRFLRNRVIHKIETSQWIGTHKCGAVKIKITKDEDVIFPGLFKKSIVCRSDYLNALLGVELNNLSFFDKTLQYFNFGNSKWALPDAKIFIKDVRTDKLMQEKMYKKVKFYLTFLYTKRLAESRFYRRLIRKMTENVGLKFGTEKSVELIQPFIEYFQIDMTECEEPVHNFRSFNEFFIRKLKHLARVVENINGVSSPADSRVVAFRTVEEARGVWIKGSRFSVEALIGMGNTDMNEFNTKCNSSDCKYECSYNEDSNCKANSMSIFICRLAPQDYHRFHSPVKGIIKSIKNINGDYLTVHPVSVRKTNVLTENIRTVLEIESNFGTCYVIAIGAALVGSITITVNENDHVEAMSELGYFEFGGSTVVVLFKRQLLINSYILRNSLTGIETLIRVGDCIAE